MKKIKVEVEVPDSFEKDNCCQCPFSYIKVFDDGNGCIEYFDECVLDADYDECPIQFVEEE